MSEAGWYPDPGGEPGRVRYWDGSSWDRHTQPASALAGKRTDRRDREDSTGKDSTDAPGADEGGSDEDALPQVSWWQQVRGVTVIGAVTLLGLALLVWLLFQSGVLGDRTGPASNPTEFCPVPQTMSMSPTRAAQEGRVHGGRLSYPQLGAPWGAPQIDYRVPFGIDVASQSIVIEPDYEPDRNWVASVLVADLVSGDGFFSPEAGVEIVARCIVGAFYGDNPIQRRDVSSRPLTVDGHPAHLLEMGLHFTIKGLQATSETALILVVSTGPETNSLYYASIPNNAEQYLPTARELIGKLTVDD